MSKPIDQLSVVEVAGSAAGAYAGRLFAGWGAEVVRAAVDTDIDDGGPASAPADNPLRLYLDHAKTERTTDADGLAELVESADVVIESSSPAPLCVRSSARPGLVRVEISPFGQHGPHAGRWSTELTDLAASGHLLLNGDPEREPLAGPAHQVSFAAGLHGFIGAAAALHGNRQQSGTTVEIAHLQVMASLHQFTLIRRQNGGDLLRRMGNRWAGPGRPCGLYRCLDGHVAIIVPRDDQLERLLAVSDLVHLLAEPGIDHAYDLMHHPTLLDDHLRPWFASHPVTEVVERLQEVRVAAAPVSSMGDILTDPHLIERRSLAEVRGVRLPGAPAHISGFEWKLKPSHDATVEPPDPETSAPRSPPRPLEGLRVVDLTRVWAGPLATRILSDLGADVITIEAPWARGGPTIDEASVRATAYYPDNDPGNEHWNRIGFVNKYALGKRSVALDLSQPDSREALEELLRTADVVIENYSPRVMPQLGLDESRLAELQPDMIYVTMPGYGRTGPARDRVAYGPVIDAHAGLSVLMGYEGEPVRSAGVAWPDPIAGLHAAAALLTALLRRASVGNGTPVVEVAQIEATLAMVGAALAEHQLTGTEPLASGNRHRSWVPQAVLPCRGEDRWVALTVVNDDGWRHLC
ncbi:MAG: CoA transferase, partial [Actinomycetota bacterium]|nr:CoA transferase [Actinomycetota bacterium]